MSAIISNLVATRTILPEEKENTKMLHKNWVVLTPVLLIFSLISGEAQKTSPFPDVPANHWAYSAMVDLHKRGILVGYPKEYDNSTPQACWKSMIKAMERGNEKVIRELMSEEVWEELTRGKSLRIERLAYLQRVAKFFRDKERNDLLIWNFSKEPEEATEIMLFIELDTRSDGPTNAYIFRKEKAGWKIIRRVSG